MRRNPARLVRVIFQLAGTGAQNRHGTHRALAGTFLGMVVGAFDRAIRTPEANPSLWPDLVKGLLILAGVLLVVFLVAAVRNQYRPKTPGWTTERPSMPVTTVPDLSDDHVRADALLVDEWRQLAEQLAAKGRFRLAMRACFFSTLGVLADHHLIMIADHKSNREYETEVVRRASDRPSLGSVFRWSVARLDRVWYGMRTIKREDFIRFAAQQQEIVARVQG
jgi:hypothetical protein